MVRIKSSVQSKKGKKKVLKNAKGYTGARSKRLRAAKEQVCMLVQMLSHTGKIKNQHTGSYGFLELMLLQDSMI